MRPLKMNESLARVWLKFWLHIKCYASRSNLLVHHHCEQRTLSVHHRDQILADCFQFYPQFRANKAFLEPVMMALLCSFVLVFEARKACQIYFYSRSSVIETLCWHNVVHKTVVNLISMMSRW